jgi:hypothetical protein
MGTSSTKEKAPVSSAPEPLEDRVEVGLGVSADHPRASHIIVFSTCVGVGEEEVVQHLAGNHQVGRHRITIGFDVEALRLLLTAALWRVLPWAEFVFAHCTDPNRNGRKSV